jgi:hypothetical protein
MPSNSFEVVSTGQGKVGIKNLRKTDKVEIFRGSSQPITSFYVKDQQLVTLPIPKIEHQGYFTIRGLDPTRYRVKVNGQEQPTSHISGSELKIAISTEHVFVEIVDKTTNAIVHTHDTTLNKTYVMLFQGGNGTYRPPIGGSAGNSGGSSIGFTEEPKKKSKTALILTLCSVVLLAGLGITGWQLGWFAGETNTTENAGTENASANAATKNIVPEQAVINEYPGYTLNSKYPEFKTEDGFKESNDDKYRLKNGKLEVKYYQSKSRTYGSWTEMKDPLLTSVLKSYFNKDDDEVDNTDAETGGAETGGAETGGAGTGGTGTGGTQIGKKCNDLLQIKKNALNKIDIAKKSGNKGTVKADIIKEIQSYKDEDCKNCPGGETPQTVIDYINGL